MAFHTIIFKVYNCARLAVVAAAVTVAFSGCEKMTVEDSGDDSEANVTLRFEPYHQESYTRSVTALSEQCSRLSVAIFDGQTRVKNLKYAVGDRNYGTVSVSLPAGTYTFVAIAHNGLGAASINSRSEVKFASNKVTDTFYCCGDITVTDGESTEQSVTLERRTAMVRLTMTDRLPEGVDRLKFYYTGGSSTFNPQTGFGCVQSKQTEYRDCYDADGQAVTVYELYTLPHTESDVLTKMEVSALDADGSTIDGLEWTLTDIPVAVNKITLWTGSLIDGGGSAAGGVSIMLDADWGGTLNYSF